MIWIQKVSVVRGLLTYVISENNWCWFILINLAYEEGSILFPDHFRAWPGCSILSNKIGKYKNFFK